MLLPKSVLFTLLLFTHISIHSHEQHSHRYYNITGNYTISKEKINQIIAEYDPDSITAALTDTTFFENVTITSNPNRIHLQEAFLINKVTWKGLKTIPIQAIEKLTLLKKGNRITTASARQSSAIIKRIYAGKNIHVDISIAIKHQKSSADLQIKITRRKTNYLKHLKMHGLHNLTNTFLTKAIKSTKLGFFFSTLEYSLMPTYIRQIETLAKNHGYLDFKILDFAVIKNTIHCNIHEGKQYKSKSLQINNTSTFKNTQSLTNHIHIGTIINKSHLDQICINLTNTAQEQSVALTTNWSYDKSTGQITITIKPITPRFANHILIQGNRITNSHIIHKIAGLVPDQQINQHSLALARDNLMSTGFFNNANVNLDSQNNINIVLDERNTLQLKPVASISYGVLPYKIKNQASYGIQYSAGLLYHAPNFLGKGYDVLCDGQYSNKHWLARFSFGQSMPLTPFNYRFDTSVNVGDYELEYDHSRTKRKNKTPITDKTPINKTTKPEDQIITVKYHEKAAILGGYIGFSVAKDILFGCQFDMHLKSRDFENNSNLPRIYTKDYFDRTVIMPVISLPLVYSNRKYTLDGRLTGFRAEIRPRFNTKAIDCRFDSSYTIGFGFDSRITLTGKFSCGIMKHIKPNSWEHNYQMGLDGFSSIGPRELTSYRSIGGREYLQGQLRLIIPTSINRLHIFGLLSAGTISSCGIDPVQLPQSTIDRLNLQHNTDIVNDKHSLRISAGAGITLNIMNNMIIAIGYIHPIKYNPDFDFTSKFYISMIYNLEDI